MSAYLMMSVIESEDGILTYTDALCQIVVKPCDGDTEQDMTDAMIIALRNEGLSVSGIMKRKAVMP